MSKTKNEDAAPGASDSKEAETETGAETTTTAKTIVPDDETRRDPNKDNVNDAINRLEDFEKLNDTDLTPANGEYLKLKEETVYNFVYTGFADIQDKNGKDVKCAVLIDKTHKMFLNGNAVLISSLERVSEEKLAKGQQIRIVTGKKKEATQGHYLEMQVLLM